MRVPKCGAACSVYFMDSTIDLSTMIAMGPEHFYQMLPGHGPPLEWPDVGVPFPLALKTNDHRDQR